MWSFLVLACASASCGWDRAGAASPRAFEGVVLFFFFFKQKTAYEIGLGIPAEPLFRSLRKSRNATSLNSRFKSLDTLKVKIISVTFRRVIRTNHKKASKIWRHENIQLGGCQS